MHTQSASVVMKATINCAVFAVYQPTPECAHSCLCGNQLLKSLCEVFAIFFGAQVIRSLFICLTLQSQLFQCKRGIIFKQDGMMLVMNTCMLSSACKQLQPNCAPWKKRILCGLLISELQETVSGNRN